MAEWNAGRAVFIFGVNVMQNIRHLLLNSGKIPFRQSCRTRSRSANIGCSFRLAAIVQTSDVLRICLCAIVVSAHHNKSLVIFIIHYFASKTYANTFVSRCRFGSSVFHRSRYTSRDGYGRKVVRKVGRSDAVRANANVPMFCRFSFTPFL